MTGKRPEIRRHRGDLMSTATRSRVMSRIRGRDTKPEKAVELILQEFGLAFEAQCRDLPGRPDFVLRAQRIAIFVDGDFWHGWRFPTWRLKLSEKWEEKIAANRRRDALNHARLRRAGWKVVRIWEHQVEADSDRLRAGLEDLLKASIANGLGPKRCRKPDFAFVPDRL
jgi:DNA mismatch endonuclease (patch repair protein)